MRLRPSSRLKVSMLNSLLPNMSSAQPIPLPYTMPLIRSLYPESIVFSHKDLMTFNTRPDGEFYSFPRLCQHIDEPTIAALKEYYCHHIQRDTAVLDLCCSWTSHLPLSPRLEVRSLIGLGMNKTELERNPLLTRRIVQDLNSDCRMDIGDGETDTVICSLSIDYLTNPVGLMKELSRVVKSGGRVHFAFGNRCFAEKVIRKWLELDETERLLWLGSYFWADGNWKDVNAVVMRDGRDGRDKLYVVRAERT